jgi:hypothetical protein
MSLRLEGDFASRIAFEWLERYTGILSWGEKSALSGKPDYRQGVLRVGSGWASSKPRPLGEGGYRTRLGIASSVLGKCPVQSRGPRLNGAMRIFFGCD